MTELTQQDIFRIKIIQFYEKVVANHSKKELFVRKMQLVMQRGLKKSGQRTSKMTRNSTNIGKILEPESEAGNSIYKRSPTKSELKSEESTRQKPKETQNEYFGCDWMYSSTQASRVVLFSLISSYFLNKYYGGIANLEERINEYLKTYPNAMNPLLLLPTSDYWQRLKSIQSEANLLKRQKRLIQIVNKLPLQFTKLISRIIFGGDTNRQFTRKEMTRLSYEAEVNINNFAIFCREIQTISITGNYKYQINLGYVKQSKKYVLANRAPQYQLSQNANRKITHKISAEIKEALDGLLKNDQLLSDEKRKDRAVKDSLVDENDSKQRFVKEFINRRLRIVNNL